MTSRLLKSLILLSFLTAGASFGQTPCDEQLGSLKSGSPQVGAVRAYISIINFYISHLPKEIETLTNEVIKSAVPINPFEKSKDSISNQASAGVKQVLARLNSEDWQAVRSGALELQQKLLNLNALHSVAEDKTNILFPQEVMSDISIAQMGSHPHYFKQNGKDYVLIKYSRMHISVFEVKNDKLEEVVSVLMPYEIRGLLITKVGERVFLTSTGQWGALNVSEFIEGQFTPLAEKDGEDFRSYKLFSDEDEIYVAARTDKETILLHLEQNLFGIRKFKKVKSFTKENITNVNPLVVEENGSSYVVHGLGVHHWSKKIIVQKTKQNFSEAKVYDLNVTSELLPYKINGQQYLAFGTYQPEENQYYFQVHKFENGELTLVSETKIRKSIFKVLRLEQSGKFIILMDEEMLIVELSKENKISITSEYDIDKNTSTDTRAFTALDRDFLQIITKDPATEKNETHTYEVDGDNLIDLDVDSIDHIYATFIPSSKNPKEVLVAIVKKNKLQLIRPFKNVKKG